MNSEIRELAQTAMSRMFNGSDPDGDIDRMYIPDEFVRVYTELLKEAIFNKVKDELVDDADIEGEPSIEDRCYLRGCNGGTIDALCHIQNFGIDIDL